MKQLSITSDRKYHTLEPKNNVTDFEWISDVSWLFANSLKLWKRNYNFEIIQKRISLPFNMILNICISIYINLYQFYYSLYAQ